MDDITAYPVQRGDKTVYVGRVYGGAAWPGELPGYCCVIGEETRPEESKRKAHHLYLIAEREEWNQDILIQQIAAFTKQFAVNAWYGRGFYDLSNSQYLRNWNRMTRAKGEPEVHVSPAIQADKDRIDYHLKILEDCLRDGDLILHWTKGSMFRQQINNMMKQQDSAVEKITCHQYPAVAGVGYAVAQLRRFPPDYDYGYKAGRLIAQRSITGY